MEETEPTYEGIYAEINRKRALLGISEKDFSKPKKKTVLKPFKDILISSTGGVCFK